MKSPPIVQGAYFADMMSKSANYCYAGLSQNTGLLLLAEVAVAPFNELTHAKYDADVDCKANNKLYVALLSIRSLYEYILTGHSIILPGRV